MDEFAAIWLVDFKFDRLPGEAPRPIALRARDVRTGRAIHLRDERLHRGESPFGVGADALYVTYDAPTMLGCHLALGWPLPVHVLDLHAEFRCQTSGLLEPGDYDLAAALTYHGRSGKGLDGLAQLLEALRPRLSWGHALLRGRYTAAVARMESTGVPLDMDTFRRLRLGWYDIQDALIRQVDRHYGVYEGGRLNPRRWRAWVNRRGIPWPRKPDGLLELYVDTFREMADVYPVVRAMAELRASLSSMRLFRLAVGADGRNRCPLRPFASKTGRNQPSTAAFIFGPAVWLRGVIKPGPGMALAYVDYEQQEFGIAAALSGDEAMRKAYQSGDPYLAFAQDAGAVPPEGTKETHRQEREQFKTCALGVQYCMGPKSLAIRLNGSPAEAKRLLHLHRRTYSRYWRWSQAVSKHATGHGHLQAAFGWTLHVGEDANPRSVKNFPLQANGAEMLRLACIALTEGGIRVCCPVHDALLVEAPAPDIDAVVETCKEVMGKASEAVLKGFRLRTEAKVVAYPERYMDKRGEAMWERVVGLLNERAAA
jgi:hypothetical protein